MGVVYKAEDTKLERTVALKFLAAHLLDDDEAKQRFLREAKAAAALDHPNICTVHEIDEANGKTFLAMAFLKGETLEDRIAKGPLALKDALDIARQVADGLQAAHAEGIVHRDIKPANILVSPEGRATIMDFGLARLTEASRLTKAEQTVGTAAYMSPEQMQGAEVDHRTDVWALGCVLYEMVAGACTFKGEYAQALAYEIVNQAPEPLTAVRAGVPMELEFVVGKCLAKDRDDRPESAQEVARELRTLTEKLKSGRSTILRTANMVGAVPTAADPLLNPAEALPPDAVVVRRSSQRALQAVAAAAIVAMLALAVLYFGQSSPVEGTRVLRRFAITVPVTQTSSLFSQAVVVSPNGRHIAFVGADKRLWIQDLDQREPRVVEGSQGAGSPFWSPDSQFVAFDAAGELTKVPMQGGPASRLCELPGALLRGGSWSYDGELIVFSSRRASGIFQLYEVPARGGAPKVLISGEEPDSSLAGPTGALISPHFLPPDAGSRVLLFTFGSLTERTMMIQDLDSGRREILGLGHLPVYDPGGRIVYQASPTAHDLWALPFSLDTLQPTGEAFPIAQAASSPSVSAEGTLVHFDEVAATLDQLVWLDRRGAKAREFGREQAFIVDPELSPDGSLVAVSARENGNQDIWIYDVARGVKTRLTTAETLDFRPIWAPSGEEILFSTLVPLDILKRRVDGRGQVEEVLATSDLDFVTDWSRDGKYILFARTDPVIGKDLWRLEQKQDGGWEPKLFLQTSFEEGSAKLSPDGRFVAYSSNESGQDEIYVQPFPEGGRKTTVSTNGGENARWSRDGKELFYTEGSTLVAVSVSTGPNFSVGSATRLFEHPTLARGPYPQYDVSADGEQFIVAESLSEDSAELKINVVLNWYEEFRGREQ